MGGLPAKDGKGNREAEWRKCRECGWECNEQRWECGESGWEWGNGGGNMGNLGGNAGNQSANAGNRGGKAGNRIEIEKTKWNFIKSNFFFFAEIEKTKLDLS